MSEYDSPTPDTRCRHPAVTPDRRSRRGATEDRRLAAPRVPGRTCARPALRATPRASRRARRDLPRSSAPGAAVNGPSTLSCGSSPESPTNQSRHRPRRRSPVVAGGGDASRETGRPNRATDCLRIRAQPLRKAATARRPRPSRAPKGRADSGLVFPWLLCVPPRPAHSSGVESMVRLISSLRRVRRQESPNRQFCRRRRPSPDPRPSRQFLRTNAGQYCPQPGCDAGDPSSITAFSVSLTNRPRRIHDPGTCVGRVTDEPCRLFAQRKAIALERLFVAVLGRQCWCEIHTLAIGPARASALGVGLTLRQPR